MKPSTTLFSPLPPRFLSRGVPAATSKPHLHNECNNTTPWDPNRNALRPKVTRGEKGIRQGTKNNMHNELLEACQRRS